LFFLVELSNLFHEIAKKFPEDLIGISPLPSSPLLSALSGSVVVFLYLTFTVYYSRDAMLILNSPAKINLFLRVLSRRPDGYHTLASLLQAISLQDTLHITLADKDLLTCTESSIPTDGRNLVLKAAALFRRKTGLQFGVNVHLEKRIPHQAGLGGGSGNAATTLWALNQLCGRPATTEELMNWSGEIGSDIPFFFSEGSAYCTGRGESVRPVTLPLLPRLWIVKPLEGLSTAAVYGALKLDLLAARDSVEMLAQFLAGGGCYFNDLEEASLSLMPVLRHLKAELIHQGFETVLMTGSGSSFFCIGEVPPVVPALFIQEVSGIRRLPDQWY
jgi:4-diphosphocytidyl-2-C-methyl-D-erythritol kinase